MTRHDVDYLFANRYSPITAVLYFLRARPESIAEVGLSYLRRWAEGGDHVGLDRVRGSLESLVQGLPPLRRAATKYLVAPTVSDWTAVLSNERDGTEQSFPSLLAEKLRTGYLRVLDAPGVDEVENAPSSAPARMFAYFDDMSRPMENFRVVNMLVEDGWEFEALGAPLPGELVDVYNARRIRDRFPHQQLRALCSLVGAQPFDVGFYGPPSEEALLLTRDLPLLRGDPVSLAQAQAFWRR